MVERILSDTAIAHDLTYVALRYFNVAGADPGGRSGQSTMAATHLIKVAVQTALGMRPHLEVFGTLMRSEQLASTVCPTRLVFGDERSQRTSY
jgi:UDP-glucose 4-epimerase